MAAAVEARASFMTFLDRAAQDSMPHDNVTKVFEMINAQVQRRIGEGKRTDQFTPMIELYGEVTRLVHLLSEKENELQEAEKRVNDIKGKPPSPRSPKSAKTRHDKEADKVQRRYDQTLIEAKTAYSTIQRERACLAQRVRVAYEALKPSLASLRERV